MTEELKPCPFCGGEAEVSEIAWNVIQCTACTCQLIVLPIPDGATEEYAIEAWNTRAERTCHPFSGIVLGGPECREEKVWRCSECEEVLSWDYEGYDPETDGPAYCEHCGSKVTGPKVVS